METDDFDFVMKEENKYSLVHTTSFGIPWRSRASLKGWRGPSVMGKSNKGRGPPWMPE